MATHKSAEKRARQTVRRTARNASLRSRVKTAVKTFLQALAGGDAATSDAAFAAATREVRKAGSKGVLHPNTVSRRVSRLARARNAAAPSAS